MPSAGSEFETPGADSSRRELLTGRVLDEDWPGDRVFSAAAAAGEFLSDTRFAPPATARLDVDGATTVAQHRTASSPSGRREGHSVLVAFTAGAVSIGSAVSVSAVEEDSAAQGLQRPQRRRAFEEAPGRLTGRTLEGPSPASLLDLRTLRRAFGLPPIGRKIR